MDTNAKKSYWNDIVLAFPILSKNEEVSVILLNAIHMILSFN